MTKHIRFLGLCSALTALVAGSATAVAKTTTSSVRGAPQSATALPAGYLLVSSGFMPAPNGVQSQGYVACPPTSLGVARYPQGGGVFVTSGSTSASVNSSFPSGVTWNADVNNASGFDTTFDVWAVCAKKHSKYTQVSSSAVTVPPGATSGTVATCPSGTRVLGGGGLSSSFDLASNMAASYPASNSWLAHMNNGGVTAETFSAYAVCSAYSLKTGYKIHVGVTVNDANGTQTIASVSCPHGQVPLGGGVYTNALSTAVNMNTSEPTSTGWFVAENNTSGFDTPMTPYVICAS
jgi:hypothetical protein